MSNIPEARKLLRAALYEGYDAYLAIEQALGLLDRKKPTFVAKRTLPPLTDSQKVEARRLRSTGMSENAIARILDTNHGRISEAINEEA